MYHIERILSWTFSKCCWISLFTNNILFTFELCTINYRRIPYEVALKRGHGACAALLNPSAAEPLVWPSPLKFISELDPEAKALLEAALMEANREREKNILKGTKYSLPSPTHSDDATSEVTSIYLFIFHLRVNFLHAAL